MKLFAVKDMKAQMFLEPRFQRSIADALRGWEVISNEGESMISRFPNDFRLYCLADFDSSTGRISIFDDPQDLGSAADFKRRADGPLPLEMAMAAGGSAKQAAV